MQELRPFILKQTAKVIALTFLVVSFLTTATVSAADTLLRREWKVDGVPREALFHIPKQEKNDTNAAPVVFAFHGHGGSMQRAADMFHIETLWPEAIVVYMNGLNTPGRLTDPEGKRPGWQRELGDQDDRDLKFFDAVFASLTNDYKVNTNRVFSTGHSNGGAFTYLLWEARGNQFSAFAPSASLHPSLISLSTTNFLTNSFATNLPLPRMKVRKPNGAFTPKPVLHIAGENDALVKFQWQTLFLQQLRKRSDCGEGKPWPEDKRCTIYKSDKGGDVVTYIHSGTHAYPKDAPDVVVKFFQSRP